jgi:hypothetical protein
MAAAGRGAAWLLPAGRREWVAAVWAEAHEVPPGLGRLAWRAGGVWVIAREALTPHRIGRAVLFAAAAAVAAWAAWPDSSVLHAAADQFGVITTVLLLAGLPLLARRFFGPVSDGRTARFLRVGGYAAILALMPAMAVVTPYPLTVPQQVPTCVSLSLPETVPTGCRAPRPAFLPGGGEIFFVVLTACYIVVILWVTSRRSSVTPATLAVGTGVGIVFGLVMYSVAPLGLGSYASNPWLPGSQVDPLVVLAWILLFGGPVAAGMLAARWHCRRPGRSIELAQARIGQGIVAGVLANLVGALFVTVLGTGLIALLIKAARLRPLVYHAPHLSTAAAYGHVLHASQNAGLYIAMCVIFPIIGLIMSALGAACFVPVPRQSDPQRVTAAARQAPGPSPHPSLRPPAAASPMPRNASPSFHDRGQFRPDSDRNYP